MRTYVIEIKFMFEALWATKSKTIWVVTPCRESTTFRRNISPPSLRSKVSKAKRSRANSARWRKYIPGK
jgi:hypothetical protein